MNSQLVELLCPQATVQQPTVSWTEEVLTSKFREATDNHTPCSIQKNKNTKAQVTPTEKQEEIQLAIRHIMVF